MYSATVRKPPSSYSVMVPNLAPQIRVAFSSILSKTGFNSPDDELMVSSTSEVAVCCSSDSLRSSVRSRSSFSSRVFSMAITAWLANVRSTASCLSDSGPGTSRTTLSSADRLVRRASWA